MPGAFLLNSQWLYDNIKLCKRLAELAGVYSEINEDGRDFLADLTPFAIEARYGDYRSKLSEIVNRKKAQDYLDKTKKVYKWLVKKVKK